MRSQLTWAFAQYKGAGPTILQNQMRVAAMQHRSQSGCHVPHTSLMLLLACYVVLVMTETNTV